MTLWPAAVTAALVQAQLLEDGTYPNAAVAFGARDDAASERAAPTEAQRTIADFDPDQARDPQGRWTVGGGSGPGSGAPAGAAAPPRTTSTVVAAHVHEDPVNPETPEDEEEKQLQEKLKELDDPIGGLRGRPDGTVSMPAPGPGRIVRGSVPAEEQSPETVLRGFAGPKSMRTWQNQMIERGWTAQQIEDAVQNGESFPAPNKVSPGNGATRYVNTSTGRFVVVDDKTGKVIQLSGHNYKPNE